jgi:hypothetical protein
MIIGNRPSSEIERAPLAATALKPGINNRLSVGLTKMALDDH